MEKTVRSNDKEKKTVTALLEANDVIIELMEILACLTIKATAGWPYWTKESFPKGLESLVCREYLHPPLPIKEVFEDLIKIRSPTSEQNALPQPILWLCSQLKGTCVLVAPQNIINWQYNALIINVLHLFICILQKPSTGALQLPLQRTAQEELSGKNRPRHLLQNLSAPTT